MGEFFVVLQTSQKRFYNAVGEALIVQFVNGGVGNGNGLSGRECNKTGDGIAACISAGGPKCIFTVRVCADNIIVGCVRLKKFKCPQGDLVGRAAQVPDGCVVFAVN